MPRATLESLDKQILKVQKEKKQDEERLKELQRKRKAEERKQRNHRLIQLGATVESILNRPIEEDDIPKLLRFLQQQEERGQYFSNAMNQDQQE